MIDRSRARAAAAAAVLLVLGGLIQEVSKARAEPPRPRSSPGNSTGVALGATGGSGSDQGGAPEGERPRQAWTLPLPSRTALSSYLVLAVPGVALTEGGLSIRGAEARETRWTIDGIQVDRLILPLGMIERLDVETAGYGAPWADVTSGMVAATTREATGETRAEVGLVGAVGGQREEVLSAAIATPVASDRLTLVLAADVENERWQTRSDIEGILPKPEEPSRRELRSAGKITFAASTRHRLALLGALALGRQDRLADIRILPEAQPRFEHARLLAAATWDADWATRLRSRVQFALQRDDVREEPLRCAGDGRCPFQPIRQLSVPIPFTAGAWPYERRNLQRTLEARAQIEYLALDQPTFTARLAYSGRLRTGGWRARDGATGNAIDEYAGMVPLARTTYLAREPDAAGPVPGAYVRTGRAISTVQAVEAPMVVGSRLRLVPAASMVATRAGAEGSTVPVAPALPFGLHASGLLTRAWDLWLRGGFQRRVDADLDSFVREATSPLLRRCLFNDATQTFDRECVVAGSRARSTVGLPCGPFGVDAAGRSCRTELHLPAARELTVGAGIGPLPRLRLDVDLVDRRMRNLWGRRDTNTIWDESGSRLVGFRDGKRERLLDLANRPETWRQYRGVTTSLRAHGRGSVLALAHTYAHETVRSDSETVTGLPRRHLPLVQWTQTGHQVSGEAVVAIGDTASLGLLYAYAQGPSANPRLRYPGATPPPRPPGPSVNIDDPIVDRPEVRLPDRHALNLQVRARARRWVGAELDVYADLMNLMASGRWLLTSDQSLLGLPGPAHDALWVRLGVEYRY